MLIKDIFTRFEKEWNYLDKMSDDKKNTDPSKYPFHEKIKNLDMKFSILDSINDNSEKTHYRYCATFPLKHENKIADKEKKLFQGISYSLVRSNEGKYYCIFKSKRDNRPQFSLLLSYLSIQLENESFLKALDKTINYLKNYWSLNAISEEFQLGLFGELHILELFIERFGWKDALSYWKGPDKGLHDFIINNSLVEIKTTKTDPPIIRIDNPSQLFVPKNHNLFLNVCSASVGKGLDIIQKVEQLENNYDEYSSVKNEFERKLLNIGYFNHLLTHNLIKIKINTNRHAIINKSNIAFPKEIHDSLPSSVKNVKYHLDFSILKSSDTDIEKWI